MNVVLKCCYRHRKNDKVAFGKTGVEVINQSSIVFYYPFVGNIPSGPQFALVDTLLVVYQGGCIVIERNTFPPSVLKQDVDCEPCFFAMRFSRNTFNGCPRDIFSSRIDNWTCFANSIYLLWITLPLR